MHEYFKKRKYDVFALVGFFLITVIFFSRLFYPQLSLFITPEFNSSDLTNFNLPIKSILWHAYRSGEVPLWNETLGTGFPLFAESQTGYYFIPNIIIYSLFDFAAAFNLSYVIAFFMTATGFYFYMRMKSFSPLLSFFSGFTFAFSGFYMGHLNQINMLQAAALFPWLVLIFEYINMKNTLPMVLVFSLVLSQQILAGYAQITFITLLTILAISTIPLLIPWGNAIKNIRKISQLVGTLVLGTFFSLLLSAVLLLPTIELTKNVSRPQNWSISDATHYSFPFKQFLGFLSPFIHGSPKLATFPAQDFFNGLLFWENILYIGIIPFFLLVIFLFKNFRSRQILVLGIVILLFGILMLGKFTPASLIYSITPFSIFRVPSRFILPFTFGVVIIFAYALKYFEEYLSKRFTPKKSFYIIILLLAITIADIFYNWFSYNHISTAEKWLADPVFAQVIKNNGNNGRVITFNSGNDRASVYTTKGWSDVGDYYVFDRNEMVPDSNATWDISHFQVYTGLYTLNRYDLFDKALVEAISYDLDQGNVLLNIGNVRYIIAGNKETQPYKNFKLLKEIKSNTENKTLTLFENPTALPRAYIVTRFKITDSTNELVRSLLSTGDSLHSTALLEQKVDIKPSNYDKKITVDWVEDKRLSVKLNVNMPVDGILVLSDMYEENWKAYDNGTLTEIHPANLISRAVVLKKGEHIVEFKYEPASYFKGRNVSILAHIFLSGTLIFYLARSRKVPSRKK